VLTTISFRSLAVGYIIKDAMSAQEMIMIILLNLPLKDTRMIEPSFFHHLEFDSKDFSYGPKSGKILLEMVDPIRM